MKPVKNIFQICVIALLAVNSCSVAQEATTKSKIEILATKNIRYDSTPDLYTDSESDRMLDLYRPEGVKGKLPVFVFVHGGGFAGGDKSGLSELFAKISSAGYAVISMNYRLYLKQNKISGASCTTNMGKGLRSTFHSGLQTAVATASEDAVSVLQWVKDNADKYGFDVSKVVISGGSAGGMTALYTAYASNQKVLPLKAVVNLWGGLENPSAITKNAPPLLTYHGDKDPTISVAYGYALHQQMEKVGNKNSVLNVMQGKGHAQYNYIISDKVDEILSFLSKNI